MKDLMKHLQTQARYRDIEWSTCIFPAMGQCYGGDWCEAFLLSEHMLALSIGDVCGHGPEQHALMRGLRQTIRHAALDGLSPTDILRVANEFLCKHPDQTATALFAILHLKHRSLSFANAGHPAPIMATTTAISFLMPSQPDIPLGIDDNFMPLLDEVAVPASALLVLYTDGVTEHAQQPIEGEQELYNAVSYAYQQKIRPTASFIQDRMLLNTKNRDDAAIMNVFTSADFVSTMREIQTDG